MTITTLSPVAGFTLFTSYAAGTGANGANPSTGSITISGDIKAGNEGVWQVDASQSQPLNRAFTDYLADFCAQVNAAGQTMTVSFSQELLAPPDVNTAAGAWAQRFANGNQVLTDTGFGSWGAGFVEAVSGSSPITIQQTGHGYITGNTVHISSSTQSGVWAITVTDANHYQLTTLISGGYTPSVGDATFIDLQTTQCTFNPSTVTPYLAACFTQAAGIMSTAGLTPWLQFGEFLWWFFSVVQNLAVGYASWTSPISIGTVSPHGLSTGQRAILAGIQGNTAANGDQTITVTDATHFTLNGSSGNGNYVGGTGTCSGGGMAYYDAYTAQAAQTALGRSLAAFYTQDDDPTVNGSADANFLASLIKTHIDSIRTTVLAAYSGAKFELLWPYDVNFATCYYTPDVPYPQGGRLNRAVNLPSQYLAQSGSGLDRLKMEALSWGSTYRNFTNAQAAIAFPVTTPGSWPVTATAYLVPWFNGGCPWTMEYVCALNQSIPAHLLLGLRPPLPVQLAVAAAEGSRPRDFSIKGVGTLRCVLLRRLASLLFGFLRLLLLAGCRDAALNRAGQFVLPLQLNDRVVARHAYGRMARDLARFDGAPADLLPPCDVGPPERVQPEALEVAPGVLRCDLERLPYARVPHRLAAVILLREDPVVGLRDSLLGDPRPVPVGQRAQCQHSLAVLRLRLVHIASAMALLDFDRAGVQVQCFNWRPTASEMRVPVEMHVSQISSCGSTRRAKTSAVSSCVRMRSGRTLHFLPSFTRVIGLAKVSSRISHSWARAKMPLMMFRRSTIMCQEVHSCWSQSRISFDRNSPRRVSFHLGRM